jgi:hypothetical protein
MSSAQRSTRPGTRFTYFKRTLAIAALLAVAVANAHADERVFPLDIHTQAPPAKPAVLAVRQNDRVVIRVSADQPVQVHLHGYDIESDVVPNVVTSLRFTATATGRFPLEIHSKDPRKQAPLAYLEVRPR